MVSFLSPMLLHSGILPPSFFKSRAILHPFSFIQLQSASNARFFCQALTTDVISQRQKLKTELKNILHHTGGHWNEECLKIISDLESFNPFLDYRDAPELYKGCFEGKLVTFKNTGRKGEALKEVGYSGALITLGRATFNAFKPRNLEICINRTFNHVGNSEADEYTLIVQFTVMEGLQNLQNLPQNCREEKEPPIEGLLFNKAKFETCADNRMDIVFNSSVLAPSFPESQLERWLDLFKDENPGMDSKGQVVVNLPAAKGWIEYLYLDEEVRITRGNRGNISVVWRLEKPEVLLYPP